MLIGPMLSFCLLLLTTATRGIQDERLLLIGLVLPLHEGNNNDEESSTPCGRLVKSQASTVAHFIGLINLLNSKSFLPAEFLLKYEIIDTCSTTNYAMAEVAKWGTAKLNSNHEGQSQPPAIVISNGQDDVTSTLAAWFAKFGIPLIEFNSTAAELSDRRRYPLLARTMASDRAKVQVMAALIANVFEWRYINLVSSPDLMGVSGTITLRKELSKLGVSIAVDTEIPYRSTATDGESSAKVARRLANRLDRSNDVQAVVCFCNHDDTLVLIQAMRLDPLTFEHIQTSSPKTRQVLFTSAAFDEDYAFFKRNTFPPDGLVSIVTEMPKADWFVKSFPEFAKLSTVDQELAGPALGSLTNAVLATAYALRSLINESISDNDEETTTKVRNTVHDGALLYNSYLRQASFKIPPDFATNSSDIVSSTFSFDNLVEQPAHYKFVMFAEEEGSNNSTGFNVKSEAFGWYSAMRQHISVECSEFVNRALFTDSHVNCQRLNNDLAHGSSNVGNIHFKKSLQKTQFFYYDGSSEINNNFIIHVSIISSGIFVSLSIGVVFYHIYQTKQAAEGPVQSGQRGRSADSAMHELAVFIQAATGDGDSTTITSRSTNIVVSTNCEEASADDNNIIPTTNNDNNTPV